MGWLGLTEDETLDTSIWALELAYEGKVEMLKLCFGDGSDPDAEQTPGTVPATKNNVLEVFRTLKSKAKGKAK